MGRLRVAARRGAGRAGSAAGRGPEVIGSGGVLTSPDDVEGIAGAMIQLCIDEAFHARMRAAALREAARFSWETTAERTAAIYARCLR